jgi:hypothetical protein
LLIGLKKYPGWELNPHEHCCPQDFKSCVSTSSTTRVSKKNPDYVGTNPQSGRPGSNRPPRPWQGRALPNELLPHYVKNYFPFLGIAKIRLVTKTKNFICIWDCTAYCSEHLRWACLCSDVNINRNCRPLSKQPLKRSGKAR